MPVEVMTELEYELPDNIEDCDADIEEITEEIDSIKAQLTLCKDGLLTPINTGWKRRAASALVGRITERKRLIRHKVLLIKPDEYVGKHFKALEAENRDLVRKLEASQEQVSKSLAYTTMLKEHAANAKAAHILAAKNAKIKANIQNMRQGTRGTAAVRFIRENAPHLNHEVYDAINAAEVAFDMKHKLGDYSE
jgi:hypothetical protein